MDSCKSPSRRSDILAAPEATTPRDDPEAMTPKRFQRLRSVLDRRQPDLTVVMENVHKPHNFSAVLRSCDAVGVFETHAVAPAGTFRVFHGLSGGTRRYVGVRRWDKGDLGTCLGHLQERGFAILAAHPAPGATDYRELDYTRPTAVLLGQELDGLTEEAAEQADVWVAIPMEGMGRSLNVSVAAALLLFEARRQRRAAGMYEQSRLDVETRRRTLFEWAYPRLARLCREREHPYPELGEDGEILGELPGRRVL
jgi:tRNA (guanosine-2'-O-)-methyltransferase